jgi:O-methyltransferase
MTTPRTVSTTKSSMLEDADRRYLDLLKRCLTASLYDESAWTLFETHLQTFLGRVAATSRAAPVLRALGAPLARLFEALSAAGRRSVRLVHPTPFDARRRAEGRDWPLFAYTMVGHGRLDNVQACIEDVVRSGVPGDLVETGVWRGGTVIFMRAVLKVLGVTDRTVWACDSFEGLPPPGPASAEPDLSRVDLLKVPLERVLENFRRFDLLDDRVRFLRGWFGDTLPTSPIGPIAILRLDGDMYRSTWDALDALYDRVSDGGYVIVDDYHAWPSCRQAVTDFLARRGLAPVLRPIDWTAVYWQVAAARRPTPAPPESS